jgi:hypothetical protein
MDETFAQRFLSIQIKASFFFFFSFLDVDLFREKERYPHHIRTPRQIEAFCFSQLMAYIDPARFSLIPVSKMPVVPAEVQQFAPRKDRVVARCDAEIPGFLKQGPRTEEDGVPSGRKSLASPGV